MLESLYQSISALKTIDIIAFISGIAYVILAARENVWCWYVGFVNVVALFIVSYQIPLPTDMGLQVVYFVLTGYGLYQWKFGNTGQQTALPISTTSTKLWLLLSGLCVLATLVMYQVNVTYTSTDVPFWDSITTALSLVATWMVARKKLENWLVWIVVDPIYVGLFYYKGYYLLALLFLVYTIIAISGYFAWKQKMNPTKSYQTTH